MFAYTYDPGEEAERVAKQAYLRFLGENGLDPTVFPSLLQLENDVVSMIANHLGNEAAGGTVVGSFTSGGTESIILAGKAAREALLRGVMEARATLRVAILRLKKRRRFRGRVELNRSGPDPERARGPGRPGVRGQAGARMTGPTLRESVNRRPDWHGKVNFR